MKKLKLNKYFRKITILLTITHGVANAIELNSNHPRLYATASDIVALKNELSGMLPSKRGTVVLTFRPGEKTARDFDDAILFGEYEGKTSHMYIRHVDGSDTANTFRIGVALKDSDGTVKMLKKLDINKNTNASIKIHYNNVEKFIRLDVVGGSINDDGNLSATFSAHGVGWAPDELKPQKFYFVGRENDEGNRIQVFDGSNVEKWNSDSLDWNLTSSYYTFISGAAGKAAKMRACNGLSIPTSLKDVCNVATGERSLVTEAAAEIGLAYQLTKETVYAEAAKNYARVIGSVAVETNGEWSMSARVGALGLIYDWFHEILTDSEKAAIREKILETIEKDIPGNLDLIGMMCGDNNKLRKVGSQLECWDPPNIEKYYLSGHNKSANHGTAIGLLAIADHQSQTKADVMPLIDTLYSHQIQEKSGGEASGVLPVREYVSRNGGYHSLFSYGNGGELLTRLRMWRVVQLSGTDPLIDRHSGFARDLIRPYIYALRKGHSLTSPSDFDGSYPKTGDYSHFHVKDEPVGYLAIAAAVAGDGIATGFYNDQIQNARKRYTSLPLWERFYFPGKREPAKTNDLKLAEHFMIAGNVLMRDSWDYDDTALLDFKSTSFASENHHHLDQNSFSLFYRAPLLVDSGRYDAYNSSHWENYYRRTIAHNTIVVYDADEKFLHDGVLSSNDGGQYYKGEPYPTLQEISDGGSNKLDGVTAFENKDEYAYVVGNASKAYKSGPTEKLHHIDGFIRSVLYLRSNNNEKPIVVVRDHINSPKKLLATSLLHSVTRPETFGKQSGQNGRYTISGSPNSPLRIRNGDGMVTIEPLLPRLATIRIVGGIGIPGDTCEQKIDKRITIENVGDCRFMVRGSDGKWSNYAPADNFVTGDNTDVGNWRIEISPAGESSPGWQYQRFLNVLRVALNDNGIGAPEVNQSELLESNGGSADAISIDPARSVVFSTKLTPVTTLRWTPKHPTASVIVVGLEANKYYSFSSVQNSAEYAVVQENGAGGRRYLSSEKGILIIPTGSRQ